MLGPDPSLRYATRLEDGRIRCEVCPRGCVLDDGKRGFCFVRQRQGDGVACTTWGRSTGFAVDPIEKKPLAHFLPGSTVYSFGTAGCNLGCRFCQNWHLSHSRHIDTVAEPVTPDEVAAAARARGCASVAFTYNDPTIFLEYAIDTAEASHRIGLKTVAVSGGYIQGRAREDLYAVIDAANIDLKAFTDEFYRKWCQGRLQPVLDTLEHIRRQTDCWLEVTTLVIPGLNDDERELTAMATWIHDRLGAETVWHLSAYHPAGEVDRPPTPPATLTRARDLGLAAGLRYVYTGNVVDAEGSTTRCPGCGASVIRRSFYTLDTYELDEHGHCQACGTAVDGVFGPTGATAARGR